VTSKALLVAKTGETLSTQKDEAPAFRRSRARDRAVLFVHGFLDGASVWDDVVARLEGRNVELIQVDLAGMGERSSEDGPYTLERFAADVASTVLRIGKPVVLVGQSMGAQVAELVAASAPHQVAALVLLTPIPLAGMAVGR
jgi:pimeloyl-ACP methyl ester carboxylesterase